MATFTNETDAPLVLPTVGVELAPGESCRIPDPEPVVETVDARARENADVFDSAKATIAEVLGHVAGDPSKAAVALAAEEQSSKPRPKLIAELAAIVHPEGTD